MRCAILLALAWLTASFGLYAALVMLELYWNLYDWQPRLDLKAAALVFAALFIVGTMRFLALATQPLISRAVALLASIALLVLAVYVFPSEPITRGMFAREQPSPLWYRAARSALLVSPSVFLTLRFLACRRPTANGVRAS